MQKKHIAMIAVAVLLILGGGAYSYAFRPLAEPTPSQEQPPLAAQQNPPPAPQPPATPSENVPEPVDAKTGVTVFAISSADSKASFSIKEVLRGEDFTAVGETSNVSGKIALDPADTSTATIGVIKVNARTLKTESANRDRAIGRFILHSEDADKEFVEFKATKIEGLPAVMKVGAKATVKITGALTANGVTRPTTFTGTVTLSDAKTILAEASATVKHDDFKMTIPSVPFVAKVDENVVLKISLKAIAK